MKFSDENESIDHSFEAQNSEMPVDRKNRQFVAGFPLHDVYNFMQINKELSPSTHLATPTPRRKVEQNAGNLPQIGKTT